MGLAVAVVRGVVSASYIDLALSSASGVAVPCAPAGNLVLAQCVFRDSAFRVPSFAGASLSKLSEDVVRDISSEASMLAFDRFMRDLDEGLGPVVGASGCENGPVECQSS